MIAGLRDGGAKSGERRARSGDEVEGVNLEQPQAFGEGIAVRGGVEDDEKFISGRGEGCGVFAQQTV